MKFADLHIHTTYSDSTDTPEEVVREAIKHDLCCIGISDHDTVDGIQHAMDAAQPHGIEVIPGVELSSEINGKDIHVLGYLFDYKDEKFIRRLTEMQDTRVNRMKKMIGKLKEFDVNNITLDEVCALADSDSLGRPHLALLLERKGWVRNIKEAFDKYLAEGRPVYVPKFKQTPQQAIRLIKGSGGVAVLAHPMITKIDQIIPELVEEGLDGLEVYYPNNTRNIIRHYEEMADKYNLIVTGGSDSHGHAKEQEAIGDVKIPYLLVENMKQRASS